MKRDQYRTELENVVDKAQTLWDVEKMREAMQQARMKLEQKYMELKRAEFQTKLHN